MRQPAVFLDRDDTLIANASLDWSTHPLSTVTRGDLCAPEQVSLLPAALPACQLLDAAGFALVVVTNQGLVARGHGTLDDVERTNDRMRDLLTIDGRCLITATYLCPMHPAGSVPRFTSEHPWRKPGGGMVLAAAEELDLDLSRSWLIGDADRDLAAGRAAGIGADRTLRIGSRPGDMPDLLAASLVILARRSGPGGIVTGQLRAHDAVGAADPLANPSADPLADPLADPAVRRMVIATGHAIAERVGVELVSIDADAGGVRVALRGSRVTAMGFLAELRRLTNAWHLRKHGSELWPRRRPEGEDGGEGWLDFPSDFDLGEPG